MQEYVELGQNLVDKLRKVKTEASIKKYCEQVTEYVWSSTDNKGSIKNRMVAIRKQVKAAFPDTDSQQHSYQYFTNSGKGSIPRWEHLALKYLPTVDLKLNELPQTQPETQPQQLLEITDKQLQTQPETQSEIRDEQPVNQVQNHETVKSIQPQVTLNDIEIEQLGLDADIQEMVEAAIAYSGISLADFVRRACLVYARTVTGKVKMAESDLAPVSTAQLLSEKYKTHPGRADELTRRAIYALEVHNNNCTERNQKWHINQTAIQTLTGSKPATIKKILENYQTRLDDHNAKHGLNPYDNRKPGIKIDDAINLVELVPDGLSVE